jgi:hypothetical protein
VKRPFDPRSVEAYLRGNSAPRFMRRLVEIEGEYASNRRRLEEAYRELEEECDGRADLFSERWLATARTWRFDALNKLIQEHNAWYPIESNLPMDPRTGSYVGINGQSYRRVELGPDWILEHFPPAPTSPAARPKPPLRVPREPLTTRLR